MGRGAWRATAHGVIKSRTDCGTKHSTAHSFEQLVLKAPHSCNLKSLCSFFVCLFVLKEIE